MNITVATVTTGVRGTDLWGKSDVDKQIICLIEDRVEVTPPAVGAVDPKQFAKWATETKVAAGTGAARRGGKWKVVLASADTQTQAAALGVYDDVRKAGYAAEIQPRKDGEKRGYIVRIANLPSKNEVQALAASLKGRLGFSDPKVSI